MKTVVWALAAAAIVGIAYGADNSRVLAPEMVFVKGGTFTIGCTPEQGKDCWEQERPAHSVTVNDFYIAKYEVTQGLWKSVMGSLPSGWLEGQNVSSGYGMGDNYPVYYASWDDAQEFIKKLNAKTGRKYRLPTNAEWEYAARGGAESMGYKYAGSDNIKDVGWYMQNSGNKPIDRNFDVIEDYLEIDVSGLLITNDNKTHAVGTKQPNELGIYDMAGNVSEWVNDRFEDYGSGARTNPAGPSTGDYRVFRDGAWGSPAHLCRVSSRGYCEPYYRNNTLGFRLALSP